MGEIDFDKVQAKAAKQQAEKTQRPPLEQEAIAPQPKRAEDLSPEAQVLSDDAYRAKLEARAEVGTHKQLQVALAIEAWKIRGDRTNPSQLVEDAGALVNTLRRLGLI